MTPPSRECQCSLDGSVVSKCVRTLPRCSRTHPLNGSDGSIQSPTVCVRDMDLERSAARRAHLREQTLDEDCTDLAILEWMLLADFPFDAWLTLLGRLHPGVVHFPIALGVVAAIVECWRVVRRDQELSSFAVTALWFAAIASIVTAASGWFNAEFESQSLSITLFLHRWLGITSGGLFLALAVSGTVIRRRGKSARIGMWRMVLIAAAATVSLTGHFGGTMVYGDSYITDALWDALKKTEQSQRDSATSAAKAQLAIAEVNAQPATAVVAPVGAATTAATTSPAIDFDKQIVPILQAHCYECHGNGKKKGGVRLDDLARMTSERAGEWVVKAGDPGASLMVTNIELPADDDSSMPPEGARVPAAEIALIRQWITQGARGGDAVSPGALSENRWSIPERTLTPDELQRIRRETMTFAQRGIVVRPLASGSSNLEVDASLCSPQVSDGEVRAIVSLAGFLVRLNLAHGAITDLAGTAIVQLQQLRDLRLDHTAAGDEVAALVATMPHVRSINFVGTPLTDRGLSSLRELKSLRKLYLWSTQTTASGVTQFRSARPEVEVIDGRE